MSNDRWATTGDGVVTAGLVREETGKLTIFSRLILVSAR